MKKTLLSLLFGALSLLAISQGAAHAGVERTANTWLLTPASWHPDLNKTHENYPFDLDEDKAEHANTAPDHASSWGARQHQDNHTATLITPVYH